MPSTNLSTYAQRKDKFGVQIGSWAEQANAGHFTCKVCPDLKVLSLKKGVKDLTQHSESKKHRNALLHNNNSVLKQPSISDVLKGTLSLRKNVWNMKDFTSLNTMCMLKISFLPSFTSK